MSEINIEVLEKIQAKIMSVLDKTMEVTEHTKPIVPTVEDLTDSNKGLVVECAILFVDIRGSTSLSDSSWAKSMAKIYRAFVRAMVSSIYENGGSVRQIIGDRVMGIFVNDEQKKATEKALEAARTIVTVLEYYFNPLCKQKVNGKTIQCGVGIDYGKALLTQVGLKINNEVAKDLVWAGKIANTASKFTDLAESQEIFVTERFYASLPTYMKSDEYNWKPAVRFKSNSFYKGYIIKKFYLDCVEESPANNEENIKEVITHKNISIDKFNTNEIVNSIVEGTEKQVEALLKRFETVVRREVALEEKEGIIEKRLKELEYKEKNIQDRQQTLSEREERIEKELEFKKNEVEFKIRAEFLSDNLKSYSYGDVLEQMQSLIELGKKINKSHLDLKNDYIYYWRLVPYVNKFSSEMAYSLIKEFFLNFPISYGMPWKEQILEVVSKTDKKVEFLEVIKENCKNFTPDTKKLMDILEVLKKLGYSSSLQSIEQKFIE